MGVARVALQQLQVIGQTVALQPAECRLQLGQVHLAPPLAAKRTLEHSIEPVVVAHPPRQAQRLLFLDHLCRHQLADPVPQPPLQRRGHTRRSRRLHSCAALLAE